MKNNTSQNSYAHSLDGKSFSEWQRLEDHLYNVGYKAKGFAKSFEAGDWAYLAGLWHDLGKYSKEFQEYLKMSSDRDAHIENKPGRVDHSTAGAQHASRMYKDFGKILAYCIAGHHAGLPNGNSTEESSLEARLKKIVPNYANAPLEILQTNGLLVLPFHPDQKLRRAGFQIAFFTRMIYSCLTDADFLDTEQFLDKKRASWRNGYHSIGILSNKLEEYLHHLSTEAVNSQVNHIRIDVLQQCRRAADWMPGLFSLTVPTGGGKTLSSLAFAMKHALKYGKERIIYVIPYTSIIEQNAQVFRSILGNNSVLEHHSNFEPSQEDHRSRLASENWDAPVVVTTNVQFFESLFACRSSQCRKLHNIANSVVILDEAQMLPVELLRPCMEVLREISQMYKTSVVLCTATQPALSTSESFRNGLNDVREIIAEPKILYQRMARVHVNDLGSISDEVLTDRLSKHTKTLCILNTRRHARMIYEKLKDQNIDGCFHLSALMCPAHRSLKLQQIKQQLRDENSCRLISTQLIEAGVDIDFPVVYRSLAGIDSIAQAAGRCNREGLLTKGEVYLFTPEKGLPAGFIRQTGQTAQGVLHRHSDILSIEAVEDYFKNLYWMKGEELDKERILAMLEEDLRRGNFPFRDIAQKFRIIKNAMESLIIPWNEEAKELIQRLRHAEYPNQLMRSLQRFTVQIYTADLARIMPAIERLHDQFYVLGNINLYKDDMGLSLDDPFSYGEGQLVF